MDKRKSLKHHKITELGYGFLEKVYRRARQVNHRRLKAAVTISVYLWLTGFWKLSIKQ